MSEKKLKMLEKLYLLQRENFAGEKHACKKGCSLCCTRNVIISSLEARYIALNIDEKRKKELKARLEDSFLLDRMQIRQSLNQSAKLYMEGREVEEDQADPSLWPCPALDIEEMICSIYNLRPMACRCMVSEINCEESGFADMKEDLIGLHTLFLQAVEHLDFKGKSGNFTDLILKEFNSDKELKMIENHKIEVLMISNSMIEKFKNIIKDINEIFKEGLDQ